MGLFNRKSKEEKEREKRREEEERSMKEKKAEKDRIDMETLFTEHLLTISADDYCKNKGKNIEDYEMKSIRYNCWVEHSKNEYEEQIYEVQKGLVEESKNINAEVVVGTLVFPLTANYAFKAHGYAMGTALIPKKKGN